ncbi:MAG TPA: DEAD/DEAH box helicase [Myxococcota bacterium]|nr:DEAD/DEAH box helicase [Myxococcota bacterium]
MLPASVQTLFEAVREACSSSAWSRGVELSRADCATGERVDRKEIAIRISTRGGLVCPLVTLYPADDDWDCECDSRENPCEHVAAAVIALRKAHQEGLSLPAGDRARGRIGYRFSRQKAGLALERVVVAGADSPPLRAALASVAAGRVDGPEFIATEADLEVEHVLGSRVHGPIPRGLMEGLLRALEAAGDVLLDGLPVRTSAERVVPHGRVVDEGDGFRLFVERDPSITEVFHNGVVLCGDTLRPVGDTNLTGRELDQLTRGRAFEADNVFELVTEILPSLRQRIPVAIETKRLPRTVHEAPRLLIDVAREEDALVVLPTLVYGDPPIARVDGSQLKLLGSRVPLRDEVAERQLLRRLQHELELVPGRKLRLRGREAVEFASRLERWDGEIRGAGHADFYLAPAVEPRLEIRASGFELHFECAEPTAAGATRVRRADPLQVLAAWQAGVSLVPLLGGGVAPLPEDWLRRFGDRIADLLAAREASGELPRCALPDLGRLCESMQLEIPPAVEALRARVDELASIPAASLPLDLTATLRSYQRSGIDWLCALRDAQLGALLADDMGLGKTLQALCALRGRTLVVVPTSVLHNWADEMARFRPGLRFDVYHGPARALSRRADVTLTSYAILRIDADVLAAEYWDTLILDEAQAIKNPDSKVTQAAYRLRGDFRITLSGTPVENRLDELWSQFHFINRGLLGARRDFEERYAKPIGAGDAETAARLRERIRPFVLRRLKRDVAPELPPRTDVVLHTTLSESERDLYDAIRAAALESVVAQLSSGASVMQALEVLLRLRQAACHSALVPGQSAASSSKIELLLEFLDEVLAEGHKALVFSQWTSLLDLVEPHLAAAGIAFARLDGNTRDRGGVVERFQDAEGPPVLLASLKAGGIGINLTAADHVFILDPWWNPAAEDQAADRAHRIGQARPVMVYRLVAEGTVEERILALQERKRALSEAALGTATGALTREDLLALLA